jgi:hypothetical protein
VPEGNFRDLGGYPTRSGRWIRPDRSLALRTVIDLRTGDEVATKASFVDVLPTVVGYHLPLLDFVV